MDKKPSVSSRSAPLVSSLKTGIVIDYFADEDTYLVRLSGDITRTCIRLMSVGVGGYGPVEHHQLELGSYVLVYVPINVVVGNNLNEHIIPNEWGYIIGGIPSFDATVIESWRDWITTCFTSDIVATSPIYSIPQNLLKHNQPGDVSLNKVRDSVSNSDRCYINEFGVGYGISRFFSWLRGSDIAGLWCFFIDNLTRLAAYNYDFWHAGGEREIREVGGKISDIELFTPYLWEAHGVYDNNSKLATEVSTTEKEGDTIGYNMAVPDQYIRPRRARITGYFGGLEHDYILLPHSITEIRKSDKTEKDKKNSVETLGHAAEYIGLNDVVRHIDGTYTIRSAAGIVLEKTCIIPVPKLIAKVEQPHYNAGTFKQAWKWGESSNECILYLHDYLSYIDNWYSLKAMVDNDTLWHVPEDIDVNGVFSSNSGSSINPGVLTSVFEMPLPVSIDISIDDLCDTSVRYYKSKSAIAQLADGSIVITDGYGSTITMAGGNITISAPGDITYQPGRSAIIWAGDDIIIKANKSVDVMANKNDVRIKAENNLHMLGGNSGIVGGVLIETRAPCENPGNQHFEKTGGGAAIGEDVGSRGVIIKTRKAPIMLYGKDIYVRATDTTINPSTEGNIILDADGHITESANNTFERYCRNGFYDVLNVALRDTNGEYSNSTVINKFTADETIIASAQKFTVLSLGTSFRGNVYVKDSLYYGTAAVQVDLTKYFMSLYVLLSDAFNYFIITLSELYRLLYDSSYGGIGLYDFYKMLGFTCRNEEQYGTNVTGFKVMEQPWQRYLRLYGGGSTWKENIVVTPDVLDPTTATSIQKTAAYPGYQKIYIDMALNLYDLLLHDLYSNTAELRDKALYESVAEGRRSTGSEINNNYKVIERS